MLSIVTVSAFYGHCFHKYPRFDVVSPFNVVAFLNQGSSFVHRCEKRFLRFLFLKTCFWTFFFLERFLFSSGRKF